MDLGPRYMEEFWKIAPVAPDRLLREESFSWANFADPPTIRAQIGKYSSTIYACISVFEFHHRLFLGNHNYTGKLNDTKFRSKFDKLKNTPSDKIIRDYLMATGGPPPHTSLFLNAKFAPDVETLKMYLLNYGPCVVSVTMDENWRRHTKSVNATGPEKVQISRKSEEAAHAVLLVGWQTEHDHYTSKILFEVLDKQDNNLIKMCIYFSREGFGYNGRALVDTSRNIGDAGVYIFKSSP